MFTHIFHFSWAAATDGPVSPHHQAAGGQGQHREGPGGGAQCAQGHPGILAVQGPTIGGMRSDLIPTVITVIWVHLTSDTGASCSLFVHLNFPEYSTPAVREALYFETSRPQVNLLLTSAVTSSKLTKFTNNQNFFPLFFGTIRVCYYLHGSYR